jgi:Uracil phosphoribosyltransferase
MFNELAGAEPGTGRAVTWDIDHPSYDPLFLQIASTYPSLST